MFLLLLQVLRKATFVFDDFVISSGFCFSGFCSGKHDSLLPSDLLLYLPTSRRLFIEFHLSGSLWLLLAKKMKESMHENTSEMKSLRTYISSPC